MSLGPTAKTRILELCPGLSLLDVDDHVQKGKLRPRAGKSLPQVHIPGALGGYQAD